VAALVEVNFGSRGAGEGRRIGSGCATPLYVVESAAVPAVFQHAVNVVQPPYLLAGEAIGELTGTVLWTLSAADTSTRVRYEWEVVTSRAWMNMLAPLMAPAFRWNHRQVMAAGARGLAQYLGVRLIS
jgi:hypothetical protein